MATDATTARSRWGGVLLILGGAAWLAACAAASYRQGDLRRAGFMLPALVALLVHVAGPFLALAAEWRLFPRRSMWARTVSVLLLLPVYALVSGGVERAVAPARRARETAYLRGQVAECAALLRLPIFPEPPRADALPRRGTLARRPFIVAAGTPRRVAFVLPGGFLDNFEAVVYDPTGSVMTVNQPDAENAVRGLFGDWLWSAEPLGDGWYLCRFT